MVTCLRVPTAACSYKGAESSRPRVVCSAYRVPSLALPRSVRPPRVPPRPPQACRLLSLHRLGWDFGSSPLGVREGFVSDFVPFSRKERVFVAGNGPSAETRKGVNHLRHPSLPQLPAVNVLLTVCLHFL